VFNERFPAVDVSFLNGAVPGSPDLFLVMIIVGLLMVGGGVGVFFFLQPRLQLWEANRTARRQIEAGRYFDALQRLDAHAYTWQGKYNRGLARLRMWYLREAEADLEAACADHGARKLGGELWAQAALVQALRGREAAAKAAIVKARTDPLAHARASLVEGLLACRRGDWRQAVLPLELFESNGGDLRPLFGALRAWAHEKLGKKQLPVDLSAVCGEEPERIRLYWPELAQFLDSRRPGAPVAAPAPAPVYDNTTW
jgi:hypothetical protein